MSESNFIICEYCKSPIRSMSELKQHLQAIHKEIPALQRMEYYKAIAIPRVRIVGNLKKRKKEAKQKFDKIITEAIREKRKKLRQEGKLVRIPQPKKRKRQTPKTIYTHFESSRRRH